MGWLPAAGKLHRNWIIATSSVFAVAAAILVVVLTKDSTTPPEAKPATGNLDSGSSGGISGWFTPSTPEINTPGSAVPTPTSAGLPFGPPARNQAVFPGAPPTSRGATIPAPPAPTAPPATSGNSAGKPKPKPGGTSPPAQNATAYKTIQGESFSEQNGVQIEPGESGSGVHIGFISTGDWVRYDDVGFTDDPADTLLISASNAARQNRTGQVELRLDSRSNAPIGSLTIANNGNWFAFKTHTMKIKPTTGVHTVYLTFTSNQNEEFANVDWLRFRH